MAGPSSAIFRALRPPSRANWYGPGPGHSAAAAILRARDRAVAPRAPLEAVPRPAGAGRPVAHRRSRRGLWADRPERVREDDDGEAVHRALSTDGRPRPRGGRRSAPRAGAREAADRLRARRAVRLRAH